MQYNTTLQLFAIYLLQLKSRNYEQSSMSITLYRAVAFLNTCLKEFFEVHFTIGNILGHNTMSCTVATFYSVHTVNSPLRAPPPIRAPPPF